MKLQKMTNHPVHIQEKDGQMSPTALIPFCEFAGNMSVMGVKIDQFDVPVCNSFRPKIIRDQLCYTVDPSKYKDKITLEQELSLALFINYNEDKEIVLEKRETIPEDDTIMIETIGRYIIQYFYYKLSLTILFQSS